ncbi:SGNH/GDSL hydrolase family protein [Crateriforma conspicua]|uniref:GDSL-like Lipase/Acylhydrolase n=1 Tax=Crateriforma conspicua TaxID=2527996 RepID=A0A5C5XZA0_9PLAN|nr:SGNH/GDSL hydrolase family protein [Crateriforma conspicua]TWT68320.1 GDSL-like Lipase/Acylhydrolase [Crateriforma conspicua]
MIRCSRLLLLFCSVWMAVALGFAQAKAQEAARPADPAAATYKYEAKPDDVAFEKLNPRLAPPPPAKLLLEKGDLLVIAGDSITEQRMYSRLIETYLVACMPELEIEVRQYGWSGEKTDGFLRRMDNDCLRFQPDVVTLSYGMNDARYRPYDVTNGRWYADHYRQIVRKCQAAGAEVVVGSPGCSGKIATWVKGRSGTLDEHNQHLCALRDIAIDVAEQQNAAFADVFWPMYQAKVFAPGRYPGQGWRPYEMCGRDGIHPDWAGHAIMAYAYLRALGCDGDLGHIHVDMAADTATAKGGHEVVSVNQGEVSLVSHRYPFCADGPVDRDDSVRSGMTFVPFDDGLNRLMLTVSGLSGIATVTWGNQSQTYSPAQLSAGVNLAAEFTDNPFVDAFEDVSQAVAVKQAFETHQIKKVFHGPSGRKDMEKAVRETEQQRAPLAQAVGQAVRPVRHVIRIHTKG